MLFNIDEVPILFPYDKVYPEQYEYMRDIKRVLDNSDVNGNIQLNHGPNAASNSCILEMPSGTGKTVSLLSITIAYQRYHYKLTGIKKKIIYCSRTMSEIEKTLLELENLIEYRNKMLPPDEPEEDILGLGLTSRKNLCINEEVNSTKSGKLVDEKCRLKTNGELKKTLLDEAESKKTSNSLCEFHENMYQYDVHDYIPKGVYSFEKLINVCKEKKICPYFTSRRMIDQCDIIIYSYHYLLDPKINARVNNMLNLEDTANTIVIFDEAHNIDNVCIESLSIDLNNDILKRGNKSCNLLLKKIDNMRQVDAERLESEYNNLLQGLNSTTTQNATEEDDVVPNPVLSTEILRENVPGNIRKAEHFVRFLKRFIEYLRTRLKVMHVISETPISFLKHCRQLTYIEQKPLQFCVDRLALLLRTLNIQDNNHSAIEDIQCLKDIVSFATLVSTYDTGEFQLIIEPFELENQQNIPNPILHFICLDPSITMKPVFEKFHTIIITSGTISPLDMYPKILKFDPILSKSYKMSLPRQTFLPLVISKSTDQQPLTTRFEIRNDPTIVRNYGDILVRLSQTIPDGLIVFFPSYLHMENLITKWQQQGVLDKIWPHKIILTETPDAQESSVALEIFKKACDNGKGALLFAVARGKVSEGIDFSNHYARAVILIGIPFQYTESKILKARLEYLRNNHLIRENDWLSFDAMRHASQCLGRVIRGKLDYGVMILCDRRFTKRVGQLPAWIRQGMEACNSEQDVDLEVGLNRCKAFLKSMAQKEVKTNTKDLSVWDEKDVKAFQAENEKPLDYSKEGGFLMQ